MKKIFTILLTLFTIFSFGNIALAADVTMLNFEKVEQLPKDNLVSIPVYLNTQGKELNSLQLKIDITGEVEELSINIGSKIPVQEITKKVEGKSLFVSLTSLELGKGWSTKEDVELLTIVFKHNGEGEVKLSFDKKETLAGSITSDGNVLTSGEDLLVKIGTIKPVETKEVQKEASPSVEQKAVETDKQVFVKTNNNLLIGVIIGSFTIALIFLIYTIYILKNQKKDKPIEPKLPLN